MLLEIQGLSVQFGGLWALQNISFRVAAGSIHGVIGPNGAGKTTLFNCISRLQEPTSGAMRLNGADLLRVPAHEVVRAGIARTFQNLALCNNLTALDNVMLGAYHRPSPSALTYALSLPAARQAEAAVRLEALGLLAMVGCVNEAHLPVGGLPYGAMKRVEFARAMACRPKLLILDEPAAGLAGGERELLSDLIRKARDMGTTVLLVEHDMSLVMSLCDRITVLDFGRVIAEGSPEAVQNDPAVVAAYLGADEEVGELAEA